ncbi:trypsin alpha-like [Eupeodes corollae]|uniref:trypsin alpha-like n=1 Tax=Eupeodes corollae TaxID=290404 RepID=UPI00249027C0|nr:trypsin alpha-like [Eupeodes corollae]
MFRVAVVLGLISLVVFVASERNPDDNDRIIGGRTALVKDCPCVASLQKGEVHKCGGAIISPTFILTAAHCVQSLEKFSLDLLGVRVGSTLWSSGGTYAGVKKMVKHPKYDPVTKQYDFAMIKLKKMLEFDVTVQPCELATKIPANGRSSLICGWGLKDQNAEMVPNMLQKANVTIISRKKCGTEYGYKEDEIKESMMCAQDTNIDACQGDSGGPLITGNLLTGLTSFGKGCGKPDYPGVYAIIASVPKWIEKMMETM